MNYLTKLMIASLALITPSFAHASVEKFDFVFQSSFDTVNAKGSLVVNQNGEIVSIYGLVSNTILGPQTINGVVINTNFPSTAYSPDGLFYFDNLLHTSGQFLNVGGILFTTSGNPGFWNLWGTGSNNYTLYASNNGGYPVQEFGTFVAYSVPELSTWAMMFAGFVGMGFIGSRKRITVT